jgi:6-phosphogluconate dehydrogenase (decarboxylating)
MDIKKLQTKAEAARKNKEIQSALDVISEQAKKDRKIKGEMIEADNILKMIEHSLNESADEGDTKIEFGKLSYSDVKTSEQEITKADLKHKWLYIVEKLEENGLKVDIKFRHDGVGINCWHSLIINF